MFYNRSQIAPFIVAFWVQFAYYWVMRDFDKSQLDFWASKFETVAAATTELSARTGIGFFTVRRIFQGKRTPKRSEQTAICEATGLKKDDLFPLVEKVRKRSA